MPIDYSRYPKNWKTVIVPFILKREGEVREGRKIIKQARCKWCNVENKDVGFRDKQKKFWSIATTKQADGKRKFFQVWGDCGRPGMVKIVLTIAHLDHDPENQNVQMDRLAALCQKCHLGYDMAYRQQKRDKKISKIMGQD